MPKVKKKSIAIGDTVIELGDSNLSFIEDLKEWIQVMESQTGKDIGVKAGNSLYDLLAQHGIANRPTARDRQGVKDVIEEIRKILSSTKGVFSKKQLNVFEDLDGMIDDMKGDSDTNPQNIPFTSYRAKDVDSEGNVLPDAEPITIYGHYLDEYYKRKYKRKDEGKNSWFSTSTESAKPPLYLAIFEGIGGAKALEDIIATAIKEIEEMNYTINIKVDKKYPVLISIPSFREEMANVLKNSVVNGSYSISKVMQQLETKQFTVTPQTSKFAKEIAGIKEIAGEVKSFTIEMGSSRVKPETATKKLIESYMATSTGVKERDIVKSWKSLLRPMVIP